MNWLRSLLNKKPEQVIKTFPIGTVIEIIVDRPMGGIAKKGDIGIITKYYNKFVFEYLLPEQNQTYGMASDELNKLWRPKAPPAQEEGSEK